MQTATGLWENSSWDIFFQVISEEKHLMISSMKHKVLLFIFLWGGAIKIGAPFWGKGLFVLVISNINIGFQKLLTLPLRLIYTGNKCFYFYSILEWFLKEHMTLKTGVTNPVHELPLTHHLRSLAHHMDSCTTTVALHLRLQFPSSIAGTWCTQLIALITYPT